MSSIQKVAIITGASQGIGAGLVTGYRRLGYAVVANIPLDRQKPDDPDVLTVPGDLARPGVGARAVDAAVARFGRVDTLVNNAGIFIAKPFTDYTDEDYDAVTGVNLRGFFEVTRSAVAAMLSREGGGHLVKHLDQPGRPCPVAVAVGAGVADQRRVERCDEGAGDRVRRPRHPIQRGGARCHPHPDAPAVDVRVLSPATHPLGRLGEIDDVVDAIVYLENAPFVTDEILHVDGGLSAGH